MFPSLLSHYRQSLTHPIIRCLVVGAVFASSFTATLTPTPATAQITSPAEFVLLMDHSTGDILYTKNPDAPMKPASMAKLMTAYILLEHIRLGSVTETDRFEVTEKAWARGGSRTFLNLGSKVLVSDLMRGIIVQSGNDAAIAIAEGIAGNEETFVEEMNTKAAELGMRNTFFGNSTGWPDEVTTTTARDLAILARALINDFPEYYPMFAELSFTYNDIAQRNRNTLIYDFEGADGLKTGHTEESGYGIVGSARRGDQRMILVMNGLDNEALRRREATRLMGLSFRLFDRYTIVEPNEVLGYASVWLGKEGVVPLTVPDGIVKTLRKRSFQTMKEDISWPTTVNAPITKGQEIGKITLTIDGEDQVFPITASESVDALPVWRYPGAYLYYLIFGIETRPAPRR